jgi:hypothetical protein
MRFWIMIFAVLAVAVMGFGLMATDATAQCNNQGCTPQAPSYACQPGIQSPGVTVQAPGVAVVVPGRPYVVYEPYVRYRPIVVRPQVAVPAREAWVVRRYGLFGLRGYTAIRLQ